MYFRLIGEIQDVETIAIGGSIREVRRLMRRYGRGRWRKLKGVGRVVPRNGVVATAELHWYEAHGIGRCKLKIKRLLD